jgi:DNA-binding transcriptional regulator YiaG
MSALFDANPFTDAELRERVEALERDVFAALKPYQEPSTRDLRNDPVSRKRRVSARERWFERVQGEILELARNPAWRDHGLTVELLLTLEDVRAEIALDRDALDADWKVRYPMKLMHVVAQAMLRQLDHAAIDDPAYAARFVAEELRNVEIREVARLLGATTKSVRNWREGRVEQIKRNPDRITLIGQLAYELRNSTTGHGILFWFDAPREQFGGRTPRELIDADVADAGRKLLPLARGGRAQLDV